MNDKEFHLFKKNGWRECLMTVAGITAGIGLCAYLAYASGQPFIVASFGSSAVLIYGAPQAPFSQPRSFLVSHFLAAFISIGLVNLLGDGWYLAPLCVALSTLAMMFTDTIHPPAGATALTIALTGNADFGFMLMPLLPGVAIMFLCALLAARIFPGVRPYPAQK